MEVWPLSYFDISKDRRIKTKDTLYPTLIQSYFIIFYLIFTVNKYSPFPKA